MSMTPRRKAPAQRPRDDGDLAVLERGEDRIELPRGSNRIERRDWRGEGVVGDNHTD